jgi:hypothetical protein
VFFVTENRYYLVQKLNKNILHSDLDWLIYSDFLEEQGINHFIREDVLNTEDLWCYEWCKNTVGGNNTIGAGSYYKTGIGSDTGVGSIDYGIGVIDVGADVRVGDQ